MSKVFYGKNFVVTLPLMKNLLLILMLALSGAPVEFDRTVYDFGEISIKDGPQKCSFAISNNSDEPLLIYSVVTSCGCTRPEWPRTAVKPGEQGVIGITYSNDEEPSVFDKTVTVYTSAQKKPFVLHVRGRSTNKIVHK